MGAYHQRRSFILITILSFIPFIQQVVGQQNPTNSSTGTFTGLGNTPTSSVPSPSLPSSSLLVPATFPFPLPSGVPLTASGKPVACSPKNTKLNPSTHKLISECTTQAFCLAPPGSPRNATGVGICAPRLCRRDQYPYGYARFGGTTNASQQVPRVRVKGKMIQVGDDDPILQNKLPPMCLSDSFCPDNGSGCRRKVDSGGECELGRDEQCQVPPTDPNLPVGSLNRALCLNSKCMHATETLNAPCTFENTTYVSDINKGLAGGGQFTSFVFKHNCLLPFFFCDPMAFDSSTNSATCQKTLKTGQVCSFDAQCMTGNCSGNVCSPAAGAPVLLAPWHWAATIIFIIFSLIVAIIALTYIHRKRRYARYQRVQDYYVEQMNYRRSILALHAAASEKYAEKVDPMASKEEKE